MGCILCAVRDDDQRLPCLVVQRNDRMIVSLNLHPYSPGHLLIFPLRHLTDPRELSSEEVIEVFHLRGEYRAPALPCDSASVGSIRAAKHGEFGKPRRIGGSAGDVEKSEKGVRESWKSNLIGRPLQLGKTLEFE